MNLSLTLHSKISEIAPAEWDACAGSDNPFVSHAFLSALEDSVSVAPRTGWAPQHLAVRDTDKRLIAAAPIYVKSHSYGEYVFDQGWAQAFENAGGDYYPKLQIAVPFSPVPGPRLLCHPNGEISAEQIAPMLSDICSQLKCRRCMLRFAASRNISARQGRMVARMGMQFHSLAQ